MYRNVAILAICPLILTLASPASAQSLRELADRPGSLVGTAVRPSRFSETAYASTLGREFNLLEPEDTMKWWVIRPDPVTFDFTQGDQIVAFAKAHRMKVRGHTWSGMVESSLASGGPFHSATVVRPAAGTHSEGHDALSWAGLCLGRRQ